MRSGMATAHYAKLIERLIGKFQAWEDAQTHNGTSAQAAVSPSTRAHLLSELVQLRTAYSIPGDRSKSTLFGVFSRWTEPSVTDLDGRERVLLREYERLCDLDLPLRISTVLLRHYSAIKRASHAAPQARPSLLAMPVALEISQQLAT